LCRIVAAPPVGRYILALFDELVLSEVIKPRRMMTTYPPYDEVQARTM
jgi:hypothetical protein